MLLVSGIANPAQLKKYVAHKAETYEQMNYSDHHIFRIDDLGISVQSSTKWMPPEKIILTTEKRCCALNKIQDELQQMPFYAAYSTQFPVWRC